MTILSRLTDEMKIAMKAKDAQRLSAIRMLISAIKYAMVDTPDMGEDLVTTILVKEAKKRRESIVAYQEAGRLEQAKGEEFELAVISEYLPQMMNEDEIRTKLLTIREELKSLNMGLAMKRAMQLLGSSAEGGTVAKIVKEIVSA